MQRPPKLTLPAFAPELQEQTKSPLRHCLHPLKAAERCGALLGRWSAYVDSSVYRAIFP